MDNKLKSKAQKIIENTELDINSTYSFPRKK